MSCPLCGETASRSSWAGVTAFASERFSYRHCRGCGSLYCEPMPDALVLAEIYGPGYAELVSTDHAIEDPKSPERVLGLLRGQPAGMFVDFGCGSGRLLEAVGALGWDARGVEFAAEVVAASQARIRRPIRTFDEVAGSHAAEADVVHLGDVIEHLTRLDEQFRVALSLLRPGGLLVAQGPLENNWTLFSVAKRVAGHARPNRVRFRPPTHVIQATEKGQRGFFKRHGLEEIVFDVSEVWWPAPSTISACGHDPRLVILHLLRRTSLTVGLLGPTWWGDRYFYVGRKSEGAQGGI